MITSTPTAAAADSSLFAHTPELQTTTPFNTYSSKKVKHLVTLDLRAFVLVVHQRHGLLLLHSTHKKRKGSHFQLPGGHVEKHELAACSEEIKSNNNNYDKLVHAMATAAARELFEETGIDVRKELGRLVPMKLLVEPNENWMKKKTNSAVPTVVLEHRNRFWFNLRVTEQDFPQFGDNLQLPMPNDNSVVSSHNESVRSSLKLQLSHEHSGFMFEKDFLAASSLLKKHSGGTCSEAILMALKLTDLARKGDANFSFSSLADQLDVDPAFADTPRNSAKTPAPTPAPTAPQTLAEGDIYYDPLNDDRSNSNSNNYCECWTPWGRSKK